MALVFYISNYMLDKQPEIDIITCTRDHPKGKMCSCEIPDGYDGFAECKLHTERPYAESSFPTESPIILPNTPQSN